MRIFTLLAATVLASMTTLANAAEDRSSAKGVNSIGVDLSSETGGVVFGASFDHMIENSLSVDGHLRLFPKDTGTKHPADGLLIIGAGLNYHFYKKNWDLDFAPGLNIIKIDSKTTGGNNDTVIAPDISISLMNQITPTFALGFDYTEWFIWFNDNYQGTHIDDLAIKGRFSF